MIKDDEGIWFWLSCYVWPRQYCNYCGMAYWTLTPWKSWYCNHPNCQEYKSKPDKIKEGWNG